MDPADALLPAHPWLDAAKAAVVDIARQALGAIARVGPAGRLGDGVAGALVPIVSDLPPVQIGLFSDEAGCAALARTLLDSAPDEPLARAQIVDAVSEIVNMLCGNVKARVARYASRAALGLPTFVHGPVEARRRQVLEVVAVTIGVADAYIVVVHT